MTDTKRPRSKPGEVRAFFLANLYVEQADCKIWPYGAAGPKNTPGQYGTIRINGRTYYVHTLACQAYNGPRPPGKQASHGECHTRLCWNGFHTSWQTRSENSQDRWRDGSMHHGEAWVNSKLTQADVDAIRARVAAGERQSVMSAIYGVGRPQIHRIVRHKQWSPNQ
jgi:hypothetical protein